MAIKSASVVVSFVAFAFAFAFAFVTIELSVAGDVAADTDNDDAVDIGADNALRTCATLRANGVA